MKKEERLIDLIGKISDEYIDEAYASASSDAKRVYKPTHFIYKHIDHIAACICLIAICIPLLHTHLVPVQKESSTTTVEPTTTVDSFLDGPATLNFTPTLIYNDFTYKVFEPDISPAILESIGHSTPDTFFYSKGVPAEITEQMAGEQLCYLSFVDDLYFIKSDSETNIILYTYSPEPCFSTYVIKYDESYLYAFIDSVAVSPNEQNKLTTLGDIFDIYGIEDYSDISSISISDKKSGSIIGKTINDSFSLQEIYAELKDLPFISQETFQSNYTKGFSGKEIEQFINNLDESYTNICIQTSSGLRLNISYSAEYNCFYSGITQGYYKVTDSLRLWLQQILPGSEQLH